MPRRTPCVSVPVAAVLAMLLLAVLAGCAITPPMPRADRPPPGRPTPSTGAVASQVTVTGHRGRLQHDEREQLLRRVGEQGSASLVQRQLAAMSSFGEVDLHAGNEARLLIDGPATFAAMFEAIDKARRTVLFESYIIEDIAISQRLAALLAKKRAEGVQVLLIYDALGSIGTDGSYFQSLRDAGVPTCAFNPVNPIKRPGYWDITHRDHRKILVVDREVAITGGINISAVYATGSFGRQRRQAPEGIKAEGWRDTQVQLRGPAAAALDDLVRETWAQQGCRGELPPVPPKPPSAARSTGQQLMRIVPSSPDDEFNRIYALLLTAIDASQRSVHLTMAYFAPGQDMIDALCEAAERGVDVRLVLPSVSDFSPVLHAGRSYYERLLKSGVKLYELQDAVLHAKTAVIDGVVSTVGSSNMDWRSFSGNNEVNAVVIGEDFGDAMARMFQRDLEASQAIEAAAWRKRPLFQRAKESLARLFEAWW
ncbi:phospholipase D-like domain-containing protein [Aquabacterium sp.]|uniref:phospholipase D-like domain-containing protein n=1 Tax=Aquabacterium sp. TaxID=1872578 RepID=UPI002BA3182D|nr:phospholipase D-like domain-containing protein [Aquabacterium sp.]HSW04812.1 phospholipase D-like domain-containing protein [Aquabacterium sp.]